MSDMAFCRKLSILFCFPPTVDDSKDDLMNGHDLKAKEDIEGKEKETKKGPIGNSFMLPGLGEQPKVWEQCYVRLSNSLFAPVFDSIIINIYRPQTKFGTR